MNEQSLAAVGSTIDGYTVDEELGVQGMAERFRVHDDDGIPHLLGIIPALHPELQERLSEILPRLPAHPNLPRFVALVEAGKMPAVVTESFSGPTLREWLDERGPRPLDEALAVFRGICEGVAAGHRAGLVHLDLRPENIVLVPAGDTVIPRIQDFGVASTVFQLVAEGKGVTTSGQTIGRPHYWAPERARRPQDADQRADVFSLGCLLYELLTGASPFAGLNLYDCYQAARSGDYEALGDKVADLPPHVTATVDGALTADLDDRIQSCDEMLDKLDLLTLAGDDPAPAEPTPVPLHRDPSGAHLPVAPRGAATRVLPFALGGVVVGALVLGVLWWWLG